MATQDNPFELNEDQIRQLISLANFKKKDVFYDLGSGSGKVVIQVAKRTPVRRAIGIEVEKDSYREAYKNAHYVLSRQQLAKTEFWYGNLFQTDDENPFFYDIADATVIYNSLHEEKEYVQFYQDQLGNRRVR